MLRPISAANVGKTMAGEEKSRSQMYRNYVMWPRCVHSADFGLLCCMPVLRGSFMVLRRVL